MVLELRTKTKAVVQVSVRPAVYDRGFLQLQPLDTRFQPLCHARLSFTKEAYLACRASRRSDVHILAHYARIYTTIG